MVEAMLYLERATLITPEETIADGAVLVEAGRIRAAGPRHTIRPPAGAQVVDAAGLTVVPGFIDLQCNGGFGHDFTHDPATIWPVSARLPQYGVTAFLPTIITSPLATIVQAQAILAQGPPAGLVGAWPLGLHLEGPFLNPAKKGAHNPIHLRPPALAAVAGWSAGQEVRLVTLAPELPGALELVAALVARGVVASAGHSLASYEEAQAAFDAGVRYGTHLFNAMPALHHREIGLPGALLDDERVTVGLIADGVHVHPALVKLAWRAAGGRLNLVTDAMAALGMPPGRYELGTFTVTVTEQESRLDDGTLAGSVLSLDAAMRNLMAFTGCSLAEALPGVTTTPAALLGLGQRKGRIAPGYDADLVLLTPEHQVAVTIVAGQVAYSL
ncbi:MAG: N-acetylglucosamine-6-phosphate deacetylase [Chloroflexi bacterium]|nr:N-acetylglucosamine-6-phosphate deacetylase [Chloroflexota bacterium]MCI0581097.1 N-acetylglucosamine-6-phosphate deacetylase [Chloroflexota bacterium]MCI0649846.1 N-acetylglucosamine-6-phosphate deacetylase [Chloroflexota bacterium]MCI0731345.1 N-acetylglucosamine-6-phosphate deacetylase [Chloroflexota bacterium]